MSAHVDDEEQVVPRKSMSHIISKDVYSPSFLFTFWFLSRLLEGDVYVILKYYKNAVTEIAIFDIERDKFIDRFQASNYLSPSNYFVHFNPFFMLINPTQGDLWEIIFN